MTTPRELLAQQVSQSQLSSFFIDRMGIVNVKSYSATGDGVTDDTTDIQEAINAADGASIVIFPTGIYKTVASLNVPSNSTLVFLQNAKIINSSDNSIFTHTSDTDNADITIINGIFEGNHSGTAQYAISFDGVANVKIKDCNFTYFARGINLDNCSDFLFEGNTITYSGFTASVNDRISLLIDGTSKGRVFKNIITNGTGAGINCLATDDIEISHNKVWYCSTIGIIGAGGIHNRIIATDNSVCYNGTSVTSGAEGGINFHGLTAGIISNNIVCHNNNYGIDVNGDISGAATYRTDFLIVSNNVVTNNDSVGIYAFESKRVIIDNNVCKDNDCNIKVSGANSSEISITNNKCYDITYNVSPNNIHINQGSNILIENNYLGEVVSVVNTINEINVAVGVTSGIVIGWNDFSLALRSACVVIGCTRSKVDFKDKKIFVSDEIDLSGAAHVSPIPFKTISQISCIWRAWVVYTEATSADAGVVCGIGQVAGDTYWGTVTTEVSKALGVQTELTIARNGQIPASTAAYFYSAGSKVGTGNVKIVVEYLPDVRIYN